MDVEWDEAKRLSNLKVHGVDFRDAALIFRETVVEAEDRRFHYGERRVRAFGRVGGDYFLVAYTVRGEVRRIISAWKVDHEGQRRYTAILARPPE